MKVPTRIGILKVFAFLATVFAVRVCAAEDAKPDLKSIQGTWEVVKGVLDGQPAPEALCKLIKFVFNGEKVTLDGGVIVGVREYSFKLDPKQQPKALDATRLDGEEKGTLSSCIYDLMGDELKLCLPNKEMPARPADFKSEQGSKVAMFLLKRAK